jgi:hypothetical protein
MSMDFVFWRSETSDGYCTLKAPNIERIFELSKGISRARDLAEGIECKMNPQRPKDVGLADNVRGATFPVVSIRVKKALENSTAANRVEYIPVRIINHKGRIASENYFALNPLDVVDCINFDASGVEWNKISPDRISYCKSLVLKEESIPEEFVLFRLKRWEHNIALSSRVAAELIESGLTGLVFRAATGYNGLG